MQASDAPATDSGTAATGARRPLLRRGQLWSMCCGLLGLQIVWGLQNANTSRIFQTLGADIDELAILWIAAPITGLLVQPIIGHWSDRTWGPLGRRRPFLLAGSLLTAIALFAMPNASTLWMATLLLWVLAASVNVAMEPFRALIGDTLPGEQRAAGYATQVFFIGTGAVLSSALPWVLTNWFGADGHAGAGMLPQSVRIAFYIGGLGLLATVGWTVATTTERPPDCIAADARAFAGPVAPSREGQGTLVRSGLCWMGGGGLIAAYAAWQGLEREILVLAAIALGYGIAQLAAVWLRRRGAQELGLIGIVEDILHMPKVLVRLALVQFFTWFGLFAMWIYIVPTVASRHFGGGDVRSAAFDAAADRVGMLFAGYNGVAALVALLLPRISARIGLRRSHAACLLLGAAGLAGLVLAPGAAWLWLPTAGIGCAWASILSMPYAMLSAAAPAHKMGVYMGIHNVFLVLPQLVAATTLGPLIRHVFDGEPAAALGLAAAGFVLAAACTAAVPRTRSDGGG
jgi:maltose/moltooligosaccharide transporter